MKLTRKEDIVNIKTLDYKDISKVIDKFLDWDILPNFIFKSFYTEYFTNSDLPWVYSMFEDITNGIIRWSMELEFISISIWTKYSRAKRYKILLEMVTHDLKVKAIEELLKKIFLKEYHPFMADIILNNIDHDWNFTFITKENDWKSN